VTLHVDGVSKRFGRIVALDGIDFRVEPGEVFGFIGPNGAGKTTTMRIVLDILRPDAGQVTWHGRPTAELPRRTFGYLPEERGLYPRMNVLEQLVFFAGLHGLSREQARRSALGWLERFRVPELAGRRSDELSKGNQQKIQFIAAILHDPEVLLMDEPFTGLDPVNVAMLKAAFGEMSARGRTLIISTHQMEVVEALCGSIAIIDRGRVVVGGRVRDVKRASGRTVVRLAVEGDVGVEWAAEIAGVRVSRPGHDYTELTVDRSVDPETILRAAIARGARVIRFEVAEPSLEEIFIERVGYDPGDRIDLAPPEASGVPAADPAADPAPVTEEPAA
jgi:ABC-2 type transport system ATP-binding protein